MYAVRHLESGDAPTLAKFFAEQPAEYVQFFQPFPFDAVALKAMLEASRDDVYLGFFWNTSLVAFAMLRGWDAGYATPTYGVLVSHAHAGKGLGRVTLATAIAVCRLRGALNLMLKVHPANTVARHLYESEGFVQTGVDARSGHLICHLNLARGAQ